MTAFKRHLLDALSVVERAIDMVDRVPRWVLKLVATVQLTSGFVLMLHGLIDTAAPSPLIGVGILGTGFLTLAMMGRTREISDRLYDGQDRMLEKQDQMLEKQDQMLEKQDQMLEKQDQMLEKQDQMLGKMDTLQCSVDKLVESNQRIERLLEQIVKQLSNLDRGKSP